MPSSDRADLELAIEAQQRLRGTVPDAVVDAAVAALRQQLDARSQPTARRRQATILFADVSGFTALSERLDAEQVAELLNRLWLRLDAIVTAHGGRVDKHIGDALMAVWGAEVVREDDPERAVRAALELQQEARDFQDRERVGLALRVGVSTGLVLLGTVGSAATEFTATGDAVNVASRLEHAAEIGGVLISHDTFRHVRGLFDVRPPVPMMLKGKSEPVVAYAVERVRPQAFRVPTRGIEGVETDTIGRTDEIATLVDACVAAADEPGARMVLIVGDAGVGKSRLLSELGAWLDIRPDRIPLFLGRATAGHERLPLALLRDVAATRFGILQSDDPALLTAKLRAGFGPGLSTDEADVVGHWLGFGVERSASIARLSGSSDLGSVARAHLLTWLRSVAGDQLMVLLLEDVHWADDETLDLLEHLVGLTDLHVVLVATARPTLFDRRPSWPGDGPRITRLDLEPLATDACRALVLEVLKHAEEVPDELVALVASRAEGNPFYVEELVQMLIDEGVIDVGATPDAPWRVDLARLDSSRVPATLSGVLQARLDGLPSIERVTLQRAAVVGRVFWDQAVAAMAEWSHGDAAAIDRACERELVNRRSRSSFAGSEEYAFRHALLRDVTYETVLLRDRAELHRRAAAWIESAAGARAGEYREMIGRHLELGGDLAGAAEQLRLAAQVADETGHAAATVRMLRRAFDLWSRAGVDPPHDVYAVFGNALRLIGELAEASQLLERGMAVVPAGAPDAARLRYTASVVASLRGDHDFEGRLLNEARTMVEPTDLRTRALIEIGAAYWHHATGDQVGARDAAQRGLDLAGELGEARISALAEATMGVIIANSGLPSEALEHIERERQFAEASGDLSAVAHAWGHLGVVHHLLADDGAPDHYAAAVDTYERSLELGVRLGARSGSAWTAGNLAQVHIRLGNDAEAAEHLQFAVREVEDGSAAIVFFLQVEADRRISRGDVDRGLQLLGATRRHPLYAATDAFEAERILERVTRPPAEVEALLADGERLHLDEVIEGIRDGSWRWPTPAGADQT